jgi:uroporphyrinogen-III synthase
MTSVLITRPRGAAEPFASELEREGYEAAIEPLLSIIPLETPAPHIGNVDAVMITSRNALLTFDQRPQALSAFFDLPCFCIGPRTAEKARQFGFTHVHNGESDGTELARYIGNTLGKKSSSILHITGRHIDGKARHEIEALGYRANEWPVYEAVPIAAFSAATVGLLKMSKLDAITVFSPRTAEVFGRLLAHHRLETCCAGLAAICLSETVADVLKPFDWRHLVAAPKPTEDSVIACLKETCPVSKR